MKNWVAEGIASDVNDFKLEILHRETYNDFACLRFKPSLTWTKASKILMFKSHLQWLLLKGPGLLQANQAPAAMLGYAA